MSIPGSANPLLLTSTAAAAYQIERSLRFNSADSAYLSRTPASAGNRKTWTWAGWVKRSVLGTNQLLFGSSTLWTELNFNTSNQLFIYIETDATPPGGIYLYSNAVFRDTSAWMHVVWAVDTTQSVASDGIKLYVNGVQVTFTSTPSFNQNLDFGVNSTNVHGIGSRVAEGKLLLNAYLADIHFIDGQALTPSSFTEVSATTGQLIPKAYTGTFGTNGFWLKFSDNSNNTAATLGKDYSGNSNNWTPNNLSVTAGAGNDSLVDTPTSYGTDNGLGGSVRGNYCTLNPLSKSSDLTFSNGNLDYSSSVGGHRLGFAGIRMDSGKWYWEQTMNSSFTSAIPVGIAKATNTTFNTYIGAFTGSIGIHSNGDKYYDGTYGSYGMPFGSGDVIGVAFDADNGTITFYKNGVSAGTALTGLTGGGYFPAVAANNSGDSASLNFGQRPFARSGGAPSGFKALCDTNLPAPVVAKGSTVMDVKLYTGNGSTQTISGLGFSPDLVWLKVRSAAVGHGLFDQVRGAGKALYSHATNAEYDYGTTSSGELYQFNSDGFNLGSFGVWNVSSQTSVAWCWDAGSSTVTNTQGSITSQVRANASAGFSIVTYTGTGSNATVGHGLGVAPDMVVYKTRTGTASNWIVYHRTIGGTGGLQLNVTSAAFSDSTPFNGTNPTSNVLHVGTNYQTNSAVPIVAYCFAPVAGYSSFGSYTGNGSADGPFVYTGFRPKFILGKVSSTTDGWYIFDAARSPYNVTDKYFAANASAAEATFTFADFLSNGFKLRATTSDWNASGQTYVYAAFAESPFQYARAR